MKITNVEAMVLGQHPGEKPGAALGLGVVELLPTPVSAKVRFVARQLKGRSVVVEPPIEARILAVAEVDAGVDVAVEQLAFDRLRFALVVHGRVGDLGRTLRQVLTEETRE